jgi:hypothetical protein
VSVPQCGTVAALPVRTNRYLHIQPMELPVNKLALAMAAGLGLSSVAQADILIDDFSILQGTVVTVANPAPASTTLGNRTIAISSTTPTTLGNPFLSVTAVSGPTFAIANPSQTTSVVDLSYVLAAMPSFMPSSGAGLEFDIISNDQGNSGSVFVSAMFTGSLGSFSIAATAIPGAPPSVPFFIALSNADVAKLVGGGTLKLSFTGPNDYDLTIDNLTLVPEPASVALLGAGLMGLGLARRRKRA